MQRHPQHSNTDDAPARQDRVRAARRRVKLARKASRNKSWKRSHRAR